jgi:uncharacterized OB-fold protein
VIAHPPLLPAYAERAPYNVIVVTLDDHPEVRMVGNLDGDGEPRIGQAVEVVFPAPVEGVVLPRWRPA